jgi:hypothetical protein
MAKPPHPNEYLKKPANITRTGNCFFVFLRVCLFCRKKRQIIKEPMV